MSTKTDHPLAELKNVLRARSSMRVDLQKQEATTSDLQERDAALRKREESLFEKISKAAAAWILDGEKAPSPNPKLRKDLVAIKAEREQLPAAIELSQQREAELTSKITEFERSIAYHAFAYASGERKKAAQALKDGLDALAPYVVRLAATDGVLRGITSERPVFAAGEFPDEFSGAFVTEKFLKGLTFFTRPSCLDPKVFADAVAAMTAELISAATEGKSS